MWLSLSLSFPLSVKLFFCVKISRPSDSTLDVWSLFDNKVAGERKHVVLPSKKKVQWTLRGALGAAGRKRLLSSTAADCNGEKSRTPSRVLCGWMDGRVGETWVRQETGNCQQRDGQGQRAGISTSSCPWLFIAVFSRMCLASSSSRYVFFLPLPPPTIFSLSPSWTTPLPPPTLHPLVFDFPLFWMLCTGWKTRGFKPHNFTDVEFPAFQCRAKWRPVDRRMAVAII